MNPEYEYTIDWATATGRTTPKYDILETVDDTITGTVWHKLMTNTKATDLITKSKAYSQWDIIEEITGKKFLWVTDQLLTVLHIQGLRLRKGL
jgi:hypothetical protein